ncbi:MAG: single-stranded-DNA-specific exonuclease RecJ [Patescibacteria group bacterium]|nr:single-stranded-DNA-specific exonuclease RecJ [Patescibacteria group bacterium]
MLIKYFKEIKHNDKITNEEIIKIILKKRKIIDLKIFLNPPHPLKISLFDFNKNYQKEFKKVIKILKEIKEKNQMIVVYTDYDADGITGGAILWETLYLLGFKVMPYVPERVKEGYGLSIKGIDNVIKQFKPALIITVDHGITKIKEIEYAKSKGVKIIITDHHLKAEKIPKANAVFHTSHLSGSGVAYFFAKEIFNRFWNNQSKLKAYFETDYLVLASIGIIADLAPLTGTSRSIVKYGLEAFPKTTRVGIRHILKEAGIENKKITPYEIGFIIAPRINATGRLTNALDSLRLLCTKKEEKAYYLANYVGKINRERQDLVEKSVDEAKKQIENLKLKIKNLPKIIFLISKNWHEGIIGLIASKIAEEFYRPTIVMTKTDGHYKGSARSIKGFHITDFLRSLKEFLVDVGGHEQASGFTIEEKMLKKFIEKAQKKANENINEKILEKKIIADLKIPISKINLDLGKKIQAIAPFGVGNPQPIFYSEAIITDAKIFGKKNEHLKIWVKDENLSSSLKFQILNYLELIAFNQSPLFSSLSRSQKIKIIYSIEIDRLRDKEKVKGRVIKIIK